MQKQPGKGHSGVMKSGARPPLPNKTHLGVTMSGESTNGVPFWGSHMSHLQAVLPAREFVPTSRMGRFCQTKSWQGLGVGRLVHSRHCIHGLLMAYLPQL